MDSFKGKNILITGASSGIGEGLVHELAFQGAQLILLARRKDRLDSLAAKLKQRYPNIKMHICVADVSSDESINLAIREAIAHQGELDVVIANAGFGVAGEVLDLSIEDYRRQFETNVFGVLRTVQQTVPSLKKTKGRLAIVGSVNGYIALPGISAYAMSKFSVRALCDALYHELRPFNISVTHIAPGFVVSEIRRVNNLGKLKSKSKDPIPMWLQMPVALASKKIVRAILRRKRERVLTGHGWWMVKLYRFFPDAVFTIVKVFKIKARLEPIQ